MAASTTRNWKAGRPPSCRICGRISCVFVKKLPRMYSLTSVLGQFLAVLPQLLLEVAPGEVGIALGEPGLRERLHHLRPGERLATGRSPPDDPRGPLAISHSQKTVGLVCGLSTRNVFTPLLHPEQDDPEHFVPHLTPGVGLEIEGIHVFVFLGRVFAELDRAVRPNVEPFRMVA